MNRLNLKQRRILLPLIPSLIALTLAACGGGSSSEAPDPAPTPASGYLQQAGSEEDFEMAFKASFNDSYHQQNRELTETTASPAEDASGGLEASFSGAYSQTYTLESEVDEADIIKYDGENLYIAKSRSFTDCCFINANSDIGLPEGTSIELDEPLERGAIRVLSTDTNSATAEELTEISISSDEWVQGLYVQDEQLTAISSQYAYAYFGGGWLDIAFWNGGPQNSVSARQYSTSTPSAPALEWHAEIEGSLVQSRRIGNTLYLVSRFSPSIPSITIFPTLESQVSENQRILEDYDVADFIPEIIIDGESQALHQAENCYIAERDRLDEHYSYPVITSITAIPLDSPESFTSICYNADSAGVYMSAEALYVTQLNLSETYNAKTRVHKFSLDDTTMAYRGSAEVDGTLWLSGQNDFRVSEHEGYLRLITSQHIDNQNDRIDYQLHILQEQEDALALEKVATLPNDEHPEEIGKDNERLFGVRFYGDIAYLVTFEQIDPLYVLDLSDPDKPFIAGELEIPGVNNFLHPVNDSLLLGLGRDEGRIKLELFNVEDISNPSSIAVLPLSAENATWSISQALWDRHAFTYLEGEFVDRIAVPTSSHSFIDGSWSNEIGLHMIELRNKNLDPESALLVPVGSLKAERNGAWWNSNATRSVLHDDAVYFIYSDQVWSGFWGGENTVGPQ